MVFWKNDEPIIDAEDDGCGAVTILVFNNLKILTIKDVVEMLKITQAAQFQLEEEVSFDIGDCKLAKQIGCRKFIIKYVVDCICGMFIAFKLSQQGIII